MPTPSLAPAPFAVTTGGLPLGGSTTFLLNLARAFQTENESLRIVSLSDHNPLEREFADAGAEVCCISFRGLIYEDRIAQARALMSRWRTPAVLACLGGESFEPLRLAPAGVVRAGIVQSDDPGPYEIVERYAPWLDGVVGVSRQICMHLRAMPQAAHARVAHISYGVAFGPIPARGPRTDAGVLRIAYLGRIVEEQKRVSRLAELARLIDARGIPARLTIAGSGPEEAALRKALAGCACAEMVGAIDNDAVPGFFAAHDAFVLLSDFEGLPLALLEAMAAGTIPVVSDLESGMREAVDAGRGFLIPVGDVTAAADAIATLACEPQTLERLSNAALAYAHQHFSAARMAADFRRFFADLDAGKSVEWPPPGEQPAPLGLQHEWAYHAGFRPVRRILRNFAG